MWLNSHVLQIFEILKIFSSVSLVSFWLQFCFVVIHWFCFASNFFLRSVGFGEVKRILCFTYHYAESDPKKKVSAQIINPLLR